MEGRIKRTLWLAFLLMAVASPAAHAGDADLSAEALKCLQCHE